MPIPLSRLREAYMGTPDDELINEMRDEMSVTHDEALTRIQEFFSGETIEECAWTNRLTVDPVVDREGSYVSRRAAERSGFHCDICEELCHSDDGRRYRDNGNVCPGCIERGRAVYSETLEYYINENDQNPDDEPDPEEEDDDDDDDAPPSFRLATPFAIRPVSLPDPQFAIASGAFYWPAQQDQPASRVLNYSYNPMDKLDGFRSLPDEPLPLTPRWLGVELEVEPRAAWSPSQCAAAVAEAIGHFAIMKSDSSVGDGGFEIVTVPATLAYHRQHWDPFFKSAAPKLRSWDSGRCGMHVHIDRKSIPTLRLGYMLAFVNDEANRPFIEAIAGRGSNHYSELRKKKIGDARQNSRDRYEALSTATNKPTVELRIFRGNVSRAGFLRNLDFADALVAFAFATSARQLSSKDFLDWLATRRSDYPDLAAWAARKGMIPLPRKELPAEPAYQA